MSELENRFRRGISWSVIGQFVFLLIMFTTNVVLARIVSPREFGVIAIASFFISISNLMTDSGLSGALVRKNDVNDVDYSTMFIFNIVISLTLYIILFSSSSYIQDYFQIEKLSVYLKLLGLVFIISSFQIVQKTKLEKKLLYKTIYRYNIGSALISSFISISLAIAGLGIWALIIQQILYAFSLSLLYWISQERPKVFVFSIRSFKGLFKFGLYTTSASLLDTVFDSAYQLLLGKFFNLTQTGFYYQAKRLAIMPVSIINTITQGVVYSTLSLVQEEKDKFNYMYINIVRVLTAIVGLISLLIYLYSREILFFIYGGRWVDASFYLKLLSLGSFFTMQELFNRILFKVFNRTEKIFILEIIKKALILASMVLGVYLRSIEVLMYGYVITSVVSYFINYYVSRTIYISKSSIFGLVYTMKVVCAIAITILLNFTINKIFIVNDFHNLFYLPIFIISYIFTLQVLDVVNLKRDINVILSYRK